MNDKLMRSSILKPSTLLLGAISGSIGFVLFYYYRNHRVLPASECCRNKVVTENVEIPYALYRDKNFRDVEVERISNETNTYITFRYKGWQEHKAYARICGNDRDSVEACKNELLRFIDIVKNSYYEAVPFYKMKRLLGQRDYSLSSIMKTSNTIIRIKSDKISLKESAYEFENEGKAGYSPVCRLSISGTKENIDVARHFLQLALSNTLFKSRIFPVTDKPVPVFISACYSPVNFYVRILDVERDKLQLLSRRMRQYMHVSNGGCIPNESFVISKEANNCCYRGFVTGKIAGNDEDFYKVFYADIGVEAFVPSSRLRFLRVNEGKLLFQAIKAKLCVEEERVWPQECIDFFRKSCLYERHKRLNAKLKKYEIIGNEAVACLDLFCNDFSVTTELIRQGFAREASFE